MNYPSSELFYYLLTKKLYHFDTIGECNDFAKGQFCVK